MTAKIGPIALADALPDGGPDLGGEQRRVLVVRADDLARACA